MSQNTKESIVKNMGTQHSQAVVHENFNFADSDCHPIKGY